ncbi:hypothetical protein KC359_g44 [Hortaea werneckii]|nr:hypothetical protein KC359_g44 [Hortaea werneckii]
MLEDGFSGSIRPELCGTCGLSLWDVFLGLTARLAAQSQWAMERTHVPAVNAPVVGTEIVPEAIRREIHLCKLMSLA